MPSTPLAARAAVRSLAADLRERSDTQLRDLLLARPDLARPRPTDLAALAARASSRPSVQRALDDLDTAHLHVLEALLVGQALTPGAAAELLGARVTQVAPIAGRLWSRALTWRSEGEDHVLRIVADLLGGRLAGLGLPARDLIHPLPAVYQHDRLASAIEAVSADARAVLDRLTWGPPLGVVGGQGSLRRAGAELVEAGLLADLGADQVALPREVGLLLRRGRLYRDAELTAPQPGARQIDAAVVDAASGAQAVDLVGRVEELAARWAGAPPRVLRSGGLAVRDLRAAATALDVDLALAAFVVELAGAAGLVADDAAVDPVWAPTPAYDLWRVLPAERRWAELAVTWVGTTRAPSLVGTTPTRAGAGTVNALGSDAAWPPGRQRRGDVLRELAALPRGAAPVLADLDALLRWHRPLRLDADQPTGADTVMREAEWLGVTGRGTLSSAGRALAGTPAQDGAATATAEHRLDAVASAIRRHLPDAVDHVLLQADLTAVAPGRLTPELAEFVRLVADVESRGAGTVYRFSASSLRRGFDAGRSAAEIEATLAAHSRTPVPQPLAYLIADVARRHGQAKVGAAGSYIRIDDDAALRTMLADRRLGALGLRGIAPTVAISAAAPGTTVDLLREAGYSPVAESQSGVLAVATPARHRAPSRRGEPALLSSRLDAAAAQSLLEAIRAGEAQSQQRRREQENRDGPVLPVTDPSLTIALMREAAADRRAVWVGHTDATGRVSRLLFYPVTVVGGRVLGHAEGSSAERSLSIHRIVGVSEG